MSKVRFKVSTYPSKFFGYQSKKGNEGEVKCYVTTIYNSVNGIFEDFLSEFISILITERLCLERGFQKLRMKDRCKPFKRLPYTLKDTNTEPIEFPCKVMAMVFDILIYLNI